jgi:hypothetical protein
MSDLKTFWPNPGGPEMNPDLSGDTITSSGSEPGIPGGDGENALQAAWPNPSVPTPGGQEDSNSVSGLPPRPNRFEPSATPPEPPSLKDRNPGTIDQQ